MGQETEGMIGGGEERGEVAAPVYYFGVGGRRYDGSWEAGHRLYSRGLRRSEEPKGWPRSLSYYVPGGKLDALLAPRLAKAGSWDRGEEAPQGHAALHHIEGWTFVSFWDRSGDSRGNSNSTFAMRGTHDFAAVTEAARAAFPEIWARFPFEVVQHSPPGTAPTPINEQSAGVAGC